MILSDGIKQDLLELYRDGDSYREMYYKTGVSITTISRYFKDGIESGEIEKRTKKGTSRYADGVRYNDDGTVNCNAMTMEHCVYGSCHGEKMCNYYLIKGVGHRRGCPAERCDKFERGVPLDKTDDGKELFNPKGNGLNGRRKNKG